MSAFPPQLFKQLQEAMCRPVGTFHFIYKNPHLFDQAIHGGKIFEIPAGEQLFRLERDNEVMLHFWHSSPGTGTRVATLDLKKLPPAPEAVFILTWEPKNINVHVSTRVAGVKIESAIGVPSTRQYRVGTDGQVYQIGDHAMEVVGAEIRQGGQPIVQPTAIEAWRQTSLAIDILATGQSTQGYIFEVVTANLSLAMLVTGFEAYAKKRFLEIEGEGTAPNTNAIIDKFFPQKERDAGIKDILDAEAKEAGKSTLRLIVDRGAINFQNFDDCKRAYNKGYGIKFGELGLSSQLLEALRTYVRYRHKIVHVSPLEAVLNQEKVPADQPVFSKKELAATAMNGFQEFIEKLHEATLALRPAT